MKIKLYTQWYGNTLICCCPVINKCSKDHGCEELEFNLDPYADIDECMQHDCYKRKKGAIVQTRQVKKE